MMKIVEMRVTPIAFADPPLRASSGRHAPYALRTIVELVSEDGLSGAAETHGGERVRADFERARPFVIGCDAYDLGRLRRDLEAGSGGLSGVDETDTLARESRWEGALRVYGAIEVAALDLIGKSVARPVYDLLGGRVRDEVPFSAYLFYKHAGGGGEGDDERRDGWGEALTPETLVDQAKSMVTECGFGSIKLKGGVLDPDIEIETIHGLRAAFGPEMPLRLDPNAVWSVPTSIRVGKALAGTLEYLEDPTTGIDGMAAVRHGLLDAGIDMPLATNMCVTSFDHIAEAIQKDAVQVVLADHHYWGGLRATVELGRICQTFGLGLSMHSNSHLGLSLLAMTHVAAAIPHLSYACDTHYPWQEAADEILVGGRVPIADGSVKVPDGPGLGAVIDQDALARSRERYERCSYRERDDAAEMRKYVDPNWRRLNPAW